MRADDASFARNNVITRIERAARLAKRNPGDVTLIAVSKTHDVAAISPLIIAGQRDFGENRIPEAMAKWPELRHVNPDITLHLIGQLQSNKADDAVVMFDVIHSLDRPSLLAALARAMDRTGRRVPCFVQVALDATPGKGGCAIPNLSALLAEARIADIPVAGLMCVPPVGLEPAPWFALLAKLARDAGVPGLSMGMSDDFETAVTLGASHVRVGTALFGGRSP